MKFQETEVLELKRELNDHFEKEVVSFLNTNGGKLIIGIDNEGIIYGIDNLDNIMKEIAERLTSRIAPNPQEYVRCIVEYYENKPIIILSISKGNELYYIKKYGLSQSGCFIRVGTTARSLTDDQIRERLIKTLDIPLKTIISEECYNQKLTFRQFKNYYQAKGYNLNDETFEYNYKLINKNGNYNILANLMADENDISIKFVRFNGIDKSELIEKAEYGFKCILTAMDRATDRLEVVNITKSTINVPRRVDKRLLDMKALREAFVNAIAHNDWVDGTPPAIYSFQDRIEIISTGGLPNDLTMDEFYRGISKPRNIDLMRILNDLDFVEQSGHGIPQIIKIYGDKVFEITQNFIRVVLPFDKEVLDTLDINITDKVPDKVPDKLNDIQVKILHEIFLNSHITINELVIKLSLSDKSIRNNMKVLKDLNIIKRVGSNKTGYWEVIK